MTAFFLIAIGAALMLWSATKPARGASGDNLAEFTAQIPPCASGTGTGVAFDGTALLLSCWFSNVIDRVSPTNGAPIGQITVSGMPADLGALTWDPTRAKIWACSGGPNVYLIDPVLQTGVFQFTANGCSDGLAYDASDDTLWASCDSCANVDHYTTSGTLIATFTGVDLKIGGGGGNGNSGITVAGSSLYLANAANFQIYQCPKDISSCSLVVTEASPTGVHMEDLECDDVTFAPKTAVWSQDNADRRLDAWEVPAGACFSLAAAATATTTDTTTATASATNTSTETATDTPTAMATIVSTATSTPTVAVTLTSTATSTPTPSATFPNGTATATVTASSTTPTTTMTPIPSATSSASTSTPTVTANPATATGTTIPTTATQTSTATAAAVIAPATSTSTAAHTSSSTPTAQATPAVALAARTPEALGPSPGGRVGAGGLRPPGTGNGGSGAGPSQPWINWLAAALIAAGACLGLIGKRMRGRPVPRA